MKLLRAFAIILLSGALGLLGAFIAPRLRGTHAFAVWNGSGESLTSVTVGSSGLECRVGALPLGAGGVCVIEPDADDAARVWATGADGGYRTWDVDTYVTRSLNGVTAITLGRPGSSQSRTSTW